MKVRRSGIGPFCDVSDPSHLEGEAIREEVVTITPEPDAVVLDVVPDFVTEVLMNCNASRLFTVDVIQVQFATSTVMSSPFSAVMAGPRPEAPSAIELRLEAQAAPVSNELSVSATAFASSEARDRVGARCSVACLVCSMNGR